MYQFPKLRSSFYVQISYSTIVLRVFNSRHGVCRRMCDYQAYVLQILFYIMQRSLFRR